MTKRISAGLLLLPLALGACGGRESAAASPRDTAAAPAERAPLPAPAGEAVLPGTPEAPGDAPGGAPAATAPGTPGAPSATTPGGGAAAVGGEEARSQDRAAEILDRAERASRGIRSLEADFTQSLTIPLLNQTQRSTGKLYQRRPDRLLMRFTDPAGDVVVADGRHFWLYYPSSDARQVIRTSIAQGSEAVDLQQQFLSNPNQRFVATLAGEESVGGRPAHLLTLVPRGPSPYRILRIWVDREDHLVRRFEITEENESVRRVELRNLRTNHALADELFTFTPPAGAQVFDQ